MAKDKPETTTDIANEILEAIAEANTAEELRAKLFGQDQLVHKLAEAGIEARTASMPFFEIAMKRLSDLDKATEVERTKFDEFKTQAYADWKRARSVIEHENNLINHRLTLMALTQGALFSAFGLLIKEYGTTKDDTEIQVFFLSLATVVAGIGILICMPILFLLTAAEAHHEKIRTWWLNRQQSLMPTATPEEQHKVHPSIAGRFFEGDSMFDRLTRSSIIPVVLVGAWLIMSGFGIYRLYTVRAELAVFVIVIATVFSLVVFSLVALQPWLQSIVLPPPNPETPKKPTST